ncbi:hypothetical protein NDU88_005306 [Pleurodeles waltl]|uniref:Uncharacterized protein n=1 Tax=Pleurodeles waltl TaxID=8319 RepID=A0AAV7V695_PLEWA|nr:hypothetical protein NDU88_005306 [Pleurodeles waltl]
MLLGPAGEPGNTRRPRGLRRKEARFRPRPLLPPSPGESGHRSRGQAGEVSAAQHLLRWWSRQRGQGEVRLLPQDSGRHVSLSRAGPSLEATACVPAAGLRHIITHDSGLVLLFVDYLTSPLEYFAPGYRP